MPITASLEPSRREFFEKYGLVFASSRPLRRRVLQSIFENRSKGVWYLRSWNPRELRNLNNVQSKCAAYRSSRCPHDRRGLASRAQPSYPSYLVLCMSDSLDDLLSACSLSSRYVVCCCGVGSSYIVGVQQTRLDC